MLSVDERHALVLAAEEAITAVKQAATMPPRIRNEHQLDVALRLTIAAENAQRRFYQTINELTRWHDHPSVQEPQS